MNPQSVALVQESWRRIDAIGPVVIGIFHKNLLEVDPRFASLFAGGVDKRDIMIGQSFGAAVQAMTNQQAPNTCIHRLERIYGCGGVQSTNYEAVSCVLINTLAQIMGDDFSTQHKTAWLEVFELFTRLSETPQTTSRVPTLH